MSGTLSETNAGPGDRRHDLDALRAFAMLLGIALHAALTARHAQMQAARAARASFGDPAAALICADQ
jgi:peptidoglycan/LPS O-acetylase OafA/YrhL